MEKVSREIANALDQLSKDDWSKQFNLIAHCNGFTSSGQFFRSIYTNDLKILETLSPLRFAKCLILGYEVEGENND